MSIEIYSVRKVNKLIKDILESNFYGIWIEGEISSLHYSSTGHLYFSLVDESSSIGVIIYRNRLKGIKKDLKNGMHAVLFGSLSLYLKGGEYRIVAEHVRLSGSGGKFFDLEKLKQEFKEKGYFDRKKAIPDYPVRIILITSVSGAAVWDIMNILDRRGFGIKLYIYPVSVQGDKARPSMLQAFKRINTLSFKDADLVILSRGGGSNEDLWIFNDPDIARGLSSLKFPTISAIGHEIDFTLCDFVADLRAETPSAAAELITESKTELKDKTRKLSLLLRSNLQRLLSKNRAILRQFSNRRNYMRLMGMIDNRIVYIDNISGQSRLRMVNLINSRRVCLHKNINKIAKSSPINVLKTINESVLFIKYKMAGLLSDIIKSGKKEVKFYKYKIQSLNPENILRKGYTITANAKGIPLKSAESAIKEKFLETRFYDGRVKSAVLKKEE